MRLLIRKILIYILFVLVFLAGIDVLSFQPATREFVAKLTASEEYLEDGSGILDAQPYIEKVRAEDGSRVLILGDSIARQVFLDYPLPDGYVNDVYIAAIGITGQYLMALEYLEHHPDAEAINLVVHPETLMSTFDTHYRYVYGVMPFVANDMMRNLDPELIRKMEKVYGRFFMSERGVRFVDGSPLNRKLYLTFLTLNGKEYVPDPIYRISEEVLGDLYEICRERGVTLRLLPSPSSEFYREKIESTRTQWEESTLSELFPDYFDSIWYFPNEYTEDLTHFSGEYYTRKFLNTVIEDQYPMIFE